MLIACVTFGLPYAGSLVASIALVGLPSRASRVVFIIFIVIIIILDHILQLLELSLLADSRTIVRVAIIDEVILVINIIIVSVVIRLGSFADSVTTILLGVCLILVL